MYSNKPLSYILGFTLILSSCSLFKSESNQKTTIEKDVAAISPKSQTTLPTASTNVNTSKDTIVWNELIHDFKDVPTGPEATTKFYFINKTNKPVKITKVNPGCSCTATDFTKNEIAANDTGFINASYKTSNTFGHFRKHIDVYLNNESKGYHLILTGNVDPMKSGK